MKKWLIDEKKNFRFTLSTPCQITLFVIERHVENAHKEKQISYQISRFMH